MYQIICHVILALVELFEYMIRVVEHSIESLEKHGVIRGPSATTLPDRRHPVLSTPCEPEKSSVIVMSGNLAKKSLHASMKFLHPAGSLL